MRARAEPGAGFFSLGLVDVLEPKEALGKGAHSADPEITRAAPDFGLGKQSCLVGNPDGVGGDRLPKGLWRRGQNERRGGLISSVRAEWGPTFRQQFNIRPYADPPPGYELWVSSQSLARASFRKLVAPFAHSARRDECNFEGTGQSIDVSGVSWCALGLFELN